MVSRNVVTDNLRTAFASFGAVVAGLSDADWQVPSTCPAWTVQGVVNHVTMAEVALSGWAPSADSPFAKAPAIVAELAALSPAQLGARYQRTAEDRLAEIAAMDDATFDTPCFTPVGPATYRRFMAIRAFDIWVHERDIRVPLGLGGDDSGPVAEAALDEVHNSLGFIVGKKIGLADGKSIAFEVTGPVTRTMYAKVDGRAAKVDHLDAPDVTLRTDSLTFMLLACGRIDPSGPISDGRVSWSGDAALAEHAARNLAFTM